MYACAPGKADEAETEALEMGGDRGPRIEERDTTRGVFGLTYNRPNKARWPPDIAGRGRGVEGDMGSMRAGGRRRLT